MRTHLRAAAARLSLVAAGALLLGCQSLPVGSSQDTPPAAPPPTASPPAAPTPTPIPTPASSEEPARSADSDDDQGADASETFPGAAPGSDACREAYVEYLLAQDPTYFDRRPVDDPIALLMFDRLSGTITADEHARWGMQRIFQPDVVPEEYHLPDLSDSGTDPLTGIAIASMWETDCLPVETQQWLTDYMTPTQMPAQP